MNIYLIVAIVVIVIALYLLLKKRSVLFLRKDQVDLVNGLIEKELSDIEEERREIINKHAKEGKTIPIEGIIKTLEQLRDSNLNDETMAQEVNEHIAEIKTKYKDGVPIEIAYEWMKYDE